MSTRRTREVQSEALDELSTRHAELTAAVARKRRREEIEEMENELAGRTRRAGGTHTPRSGSQVSESFLPRARALAPPVFTATSLGELRKHLQGAVVYFDAINEQDERRRVATAASYCRDEALSQWVRLADKPVSWHEYENLLRNMIQDPANRMGIALLAIKEAVQETRSAREFATYLDELEDDVPPLSQEELRAWTLVNGLRPALRTAVLREEREIRNRAQIVAAAQRLEILQKTELSEGVTQEKRTRDAGERDLRVRGLRVRGVAFAV
jgi:hypothetical protein